MWLSKQYNLEIAYKSAPSFDDYEGCLNAVKQSGYNLESIEDQTEELCLETVKKTPNAIRYVKNQTYEMAKIAVANGSTLGFINESLIDEELCKIALGKHSKQDFRYVPDKFKTYEMCLDAVSPWPSGLQFVPEQFQTKELIKTAIKQGPYAFSHVVHQTKELIKYLFELNHCVYDWIRDIDLRKDEEIIWLTLKFDPGMLSNIPYESQTIEMIEFCMAERNWLADSINTDIFPIKDWPIKWFGDIQNVETKRKFIKEHGNKVFQQLDDLKVIDEIEDYALLSYYLGDGVGSDEYGDEEYIIIEGVALIYHCPSSGDLYFTEIDPKITKVNEALQFLNNGIKREDLAYES